MASIESLSPEKTDSEDVLSGKCHWSLQDQGTVDKGIESSLGQADVSILIENIHIPHVFHSSNN